MLSKTISQGIFQTGYGRFRPNKRGSHLWRWGYRGGWHQSCPPLIPRDFHSREKHRINPGHSESPRHAFAHCEVFATAAPLRARTSISVSFSGQPLSRPLRVLGLVSHYLTNYLMRRRPIVKRRSFLEQQDSTRCSLSGIILSFPRLSRSSRDVIDVLLSSLHCLAANTCMS